MEINNKKIYDEKWSTWLDMRKYGPASRWLRFLIFDILKNVRLEDINSILDLGCGEGTTTFYIAKKFPMIQVIGIDFSKNGIELAQKHYNLKNLRFFHDLNSSLLLNKYDLISAFEVLEHVDDWRSLLARMAKASNKYLLLSFPTGRMRPYEKNVGHFRNFQKGEVENFLDAYNFKPIKVFYAGFPFYSPIYREICNLTNSANNNFTQGRYGLAQKIISNLVYFFLRFLSTRNNRGDQFCGFFIKK